MKWMIASDIHGSAYYCEKLMNRYSVENIDRMMLLGDLLYHGPRNNLPDEYSPKLVIDMLNGIKDDIICVRGNCDTEVDQMVLEFPIMAEYALLELEDRMVFATHGHLYNETHLPPLHKGDILLHGHTHVPKCTDHGSYIYMNPGSVSIPKENSQHGYMTFEDGIFMWKNLNGDIINQYTLTSI